MTENNICGDVYRRIMM